MEKLTILENSFASLWYHPLERVVHHEFHGFICGDEFRNVLSKGLEALKQHKATKWLSDDRKNGAVPKLDQQWAKEVWHPAAIAAGWKTWALVAPEAMVGQWNAKRFTEASAAGGLNVRVFKTPTEALEWLSTVPS